MKKMSQENRHGEMNILFRKDLSKVLQFEKDEHLFTKQFLTNIENMHKRLNKKDPIFENFLNE